MPVKNTMEETKNLQGSNLSWRSKTQKSFRV